MACFRFRFQPALDLAARDEEAARRARFLAREALAFAVAALRDVDARIEAERAPLGIGTPVCSAWLLLGDERRRALESLRGSAAAQVKRGEREFGRRRSAFEAAMCRRSALERLRERRRVEHFRLEALAIARELDEANERAAAGLKCSAAEDSPRWMR
jgi:hypothetical protein